MNNNGVTRLSETQRVKSPKSLNRPSYHFFLCVHCVLCGEMAPFIDACIDVELRKPIAHGPH